MSSANSANNSNSSNHNNSSNNASHLSQLNDLRSYSRMWLTEFIELYKQAECLWSPKHPDYGNHTVRNKAYDRLVEKLKEVEPNPDRPMVIRKINSLRSAFRREYRKSSAKSNYETRLWYYDKLFFIANQHSKRLTASSPPAPSTKMTIKRQLPLSFDDGDSMEYEEHDPEQHQTIHLDNGTVAQVETEKYQSDSLGTLTVTGDACVTLVKNEEHHQQQQQNQTQQQQIHIQQQHQSNQPQHATAVKVLEITSLDSNSQREIQQAVNSLEHQHMQQLQQQQAGQNGQITQVPTIQIAREHLHPIFANSTYSTAPAQQHQQDEYDAIGLNVASKLRCMHPTQRIVAEKLISDVLFNGQLENLTVNSALTH